MGRKGKRAIKNDPAMFICFFWAKEIPDHAANKEKYRTGECEKRNNGRVVSRREGRKKRRRRGRGVINGVVRDITSDR